MHLARISLIWLNMKLSPPGEGIPHTIGGRMNKIVYVGMDVHKEKTALVCFEPSFDGSSEKGKFYGAAEVATPSGTDGREINIPFP